MLIRKEKFLVFFLLLLMFAMTSKSQNTQHWQKIQVGQTSQYGDRGFRVQCYSKDTIFVLGYKLYYSHNGGSSFGSATLEGNELSFDFGDNKTGYIVGNNGSIKKSTDGGQTWNNLPLFTSQSLYAVDFIDKSNGLVAGTNGAIYRTTNGGNSWSQITSGVTGILFAVKWINKNIVLVGGEAGIMLRSTDGGNSFTKNTNFNKFGYVSNIVYYNPANQFAGNENSAWLYDEHVILATGGYQTISRSTDYGITWTRTLPEQPNPSLGSNYNMVSIVDNKKAFALGVSPLYGPALYISENGGKDWVNYSLPNDYLPYAFDFVDHYKLFGMGNIPANQNPYVLKYSHQGEAITLLTPDASGYNFISKQKIPITWRANQVNNVIIEYSTNGGSNWLRITKIAADSNYYLWEIPETPSANCLIKISSESNSSVFDESDNQFAILNEFWQMHSTPTEKDLFCSAFPTPDIAYAAGKSGIFLKSTDSAKTWTALNNGINEDITTISFINSNSGYAGTVKGNVFKTENGGLTWQACTGLDTTRSIKKIVAIDAFKAILLFKSSNQLYLTNNGGQTWGQAELASSNTINDIDSKMGWSFAVGKNGLILKSSDNLYLWEKLNVITQTDFEFVTMATNKIGYLASKTSNGIFYTMDGFDTLYLKTFPVEKAVLDLKATAPSTAFILLSDAYIYSTDNFGSSWQDQSFRFNNVLPAYLRSISFSQAPLLFRGKNGFAIGNLGYCYRKAFGTPDYSLSFKNQPLNYDYIARHDSITIDWQGFGFKFVSVYFYELLHNKRVLVADNLSLQWGKITIPIQQQHMGFIRIELESPEVPGLVIKSDSIYRIPAVVISNFNRPYTIGEWMDMSSIEHGIIVSKCIKVIGGKVDTVMAVNETNQAGNWIQHTEFVASFQVMPSVSDNNTRFLLNRYGFKQKLNRTTNLGQTWNMLDEFTVLPFWSGYRYPIISWYNSMNGLWNMNGIQKSTDGGFSWTDSYFNDYTGIPYIKSAHLLSPFKGRARSNKGEMFFSNDGGVNWTLYSVDPDTTYFYSPINQDYAFVVSKSDQNKWNIKSSVDGGSTWQIKSVLEPLKDGENNIDNIQCYFVSDSIGIIIAEKHKLLLTTDAGTTWNTINNQNAVFKSAHTVTGKRAAFLPFMAASLGDGKILAFHSFFNKIPTKVEENNSTAGIKPVDYSLKQNYPNPFNPVTTITFSIGHNLKNNQKENVILKVTDVLGRLVETLINEEKTPGHYSIEWNASNYSSGIYFSELIVGGHHLYKKMLLLK